MLNTGTHQSNYPGRPQRGESESTSEAEIPALPMALARMNSDNLTPRDLSDSVSTSRSCGRKRTATRAVRCRDSERCGRGVSRCAALVLTGARLSSSAGLSTGRHPITREPLSGITALVCRGGYTAAACDHQGLSRRSGYLQLLVAEVGNELEGAAKGSNKAVEHILG
jgi:hypothetical protein